jgi:hypothetical protein
MSRGDLSPYMVEVNRVARLLMDEWARVEPAHGVTLHHVSYIATFVDMAKVVVNDALARGLKIVKGEDRT